MAVSHAQFVSLCRARSTLATISEKRISVEEVARQACISPFHFIRQFRALFGTTPHQYRIESRLSQAKLLLAKNEHSITEVCFEVGFESLGSFSDLFTRRVGMTPSQFRMSVRATVQVPSCFSPVYFPGCLSLMAKLPPDAFRNFQEANLSRSPVQSA